LGFRLSLCKLGLEVSVVQHPGSFIDLLVIEEVGLVDGTSHSADGLQATPVRLLSPVLLQELLLHFVQLVKLHRSSVLVELQGSVVIDLFFNGLFICEILSVAASTSTSSAGELGFVLRHLAGRIRSGRAICLTTSASITL